MRFEDAISTALTELQAKPKEEKPRRRIGFIQDDKLVLEVSQSPERAEGHTLTIPPPHGGGQERERALHSMRRLCESPHLTSPRGRGTNL